MTNHGITRNKALELPLNLSTRLCLGCKRTRSRAQFIGEAEVCTKCALRGIPPTPVKRRIGK